MSDPDGGPGVMRRSTPLLPGAKARVASARYHLEGALLATRPEGAAPVPSKVCHAYEPLAALELRPNTAMVTFERRASPWC